MITQQITPCLWFNGNAEEAVSFYTSVFQGAEEGSTTYYGEGAPFPKGTVLTKTFKVAGQEFVALNGGPQFPFTPAISFVINCQTQEEIDTYWEKLSADPAQEQCGWLKDKFGVSWQVVPVALTQLLTDPDEAKVGRVMQAVLQMKKLVIADLLKASEGE